MTCEESETDNIHLLKKQIKSQPASWWTAWPKQGFEHYRP